MINLTYQKETINGTLHILAFVLLVCKADADTVVEKFDERIIQNKQLVACPYYRVSDAVFVW